MSWFAATLVRPIDATLPIGVVLDISHEGILAFKIREVGLAGLSHRHAFGPSDHGIAMKIYVGRASQFAVLSHDELFDSGCGAFLGCRTRRPRLKCCSTNAREFG